MNKAFLANLLVRANAFAPFRIMNRGRLLVLMYHRFSEGEEWGKTSRATCEKHLRYLTRHYRIITLAEAVSRMVNGDPVPPRSAVITVDDGYRDFFDVAFPLLAEYKVPATLYIVTGFVDGKCWIWTDKARYLLAAAKADRMEFELNGKRISARLTDLPSRLNTASSLNAELKKLKDIEKDRVLADLARSLNVELPEFPPQEFAPLSWDEARHVRAGHVEIGSHTETHPILTNVDEIRLESELRTSKTRIQEQFQTEAVHFCYPNGNVSPRERDAAEAAGYVSAVTTELKLCENNADKFLLPRIDAEPDMHRFVQATSGFDRVKPNA